MKDVCIGIGMGFILLAILRSRGNKMKDAYMRIIMWLIVHGCIGMGMWLIVLTILSFMNFGDEEVDPQIGEVWASNVSNPFLDEEDKRIVLDIKDGYVKYSKIHNGVKIIDSDNMFRFKDVYNLYTYEEK